MSERPLWYGSMGVWRCGGSFFLLPHLHTPTRPYLAKKYSFSWRNLKGLLVLLVVLGCTRVTTPDERLQAAGTHAAGLLTQARVATNAGDYTEAFERVDSLIHVAPDLPDAYFQRGYLLMQLYQLDAAQEAFREVVALDPYHRGGWYHQGHVFFEQGRYREAIRLYHRQREVILSSPKALRAYHRDTDAAALPQSWLQIGRAYELLQRPDSARWAYEEVLALDATHAQANAWLADLYDEEGRTSEALAAARRAWLKGQDNPDFAYQFGRLLLKEGNLEEALPLFEYAAARQPWVPGIHYNLGRTLIALGQRERGERHLAVTDQLQDLDQQIDLVRAGIARYPDNVDRWRELAELLETAGRRAELQQVREVVRALDEEVHSAAQ